MKAGLFTGLGFSAADCLYASARVFGLTLISDFLQKYQALSNSEAGQLDDEKSSDSPDSSDSPNTQQEEPPVSQADDDSDSEENTVE